MQGDKAVKLKARLGVPDLQDLAPGVFAALDRPFVAVVVLYRRRRLATAVQFTDRVEERGATEPRHVAVEDNHTVQIAVQHLAEDRKTVVQGKRGEVSLDLGGSGTRKK